MKIARRVFAAMESDLAHVQKNLALVREQVDRIVDEHHLFKPRLVAVSKLKGIEYVKEAYAAGQRVFGENYVQELVEKAPQLPDDIEWHMIGHVTSSNSKNLLKVKNLSLLETVDSEKFARRMNRLLEEEERRLKVFVQVNTSGEESKYGVEPSEAVALCTFVHRECPALELSGLMTIGKYHGDASEDFARLVDVRTQVSKELGIALADLELSMGMSGDFETALKAGSTNIRIGSTIFGARPKKT